MKFMVIVKGSANSEAGHMPSARLLTDMGRFNEEMVNAGILLAAEGLHPSSRGVRIHYDGQARTVSQGPFDDPTTLVGGYWLIEVASLDEAVAWMRRCPNPNEDGQSEIEIRQVYTAEDFGDALTSEMREQEERLRERVERR